ncbi:GNAT family N-acetyltransferase [Pseudomonas chlororaphis]|uniref:GNAT family N-acetyltransferase n=1 Tax=Pseudomonas chlororaphis TaxID=587753 RepID=UPI00236545EF|nr:GNAT family N-acetyltransferase [Pseudomonas chlororaphis]WDH25788.1 GNAT family N-acetyltransferase [Pseudomonas chlororaphis]
MTDLRPTEPGAVDAIAYQRASSALQRAFALLQQRVYPEPDAPEDAEDAEDAPLHAPVFDTFSFYICAPDRVLSYAAVAMKTIEHAGHTFDIAGLSCVMTDPACQGQGLGLRTVAAATRCMEHSNLDIGVFTCDPPLARFYARAGGWPIAPDVVLIGNRHEMALRSDTLGKVVLLRLFSPKAIAAASVLTHGVIDLALPDGQFL